MTPHTESPKEDNLNSENLRTFQVGENGSWVTNREKANLSLPASFSLQRKRTLHERRGRERGRLGGIWTCLSFSCEMGGGEMQVWGMGPLNIDRTTDSQAFTECVFWQFPTQQP